MTDVKVHELTKALGPAAGEQRLTKFVEALVPAIKEALAAGKDVSLAGFGTFSVAQADGRPVPALSKANVLADVSAKLGEAGEPRVKGLQDALLEAVGKELLAGRRVVFDDLGVLEIVFDRPKIERQPKGHRLIKPASSGLAFTATDAVLTRAGGGKLVFSPSDDLRKRLESFKQSSIMLVVPERDYFAKTLEYYFENAGWEIETSTKVADALARLETGKAYLVILDAHFEDHQKLCYALKMRRETSHVPLLLLYPSAAALAGLPGVSIIGDENLAQPFEFRQLLDYADTEIIRAAEEELIFLQQINIHLPTEEQPIEKVIDMIHKLLEASGLNEEGQVAMSAAFREAVVNAAQHGNRYRRERKIEVQYLLDAEKITAVVKDQGQGFNHDQFVKSGSTRDAISAARERHAQGRMGGLGIMLMLRCCERLEYNQQGNQITLTKYLKPPG